MLAADDEPLLATARVMAGVVEHLGPPGPALEQRVADLGRYRAAPARSGAARRIAWATAALVVSLVAVMALTPIGQTALASFMAVFHLGRTEVRITPASPSGVAATVTEAPSTAALRQEMTLAEAREDMWFIIPEPAYLPRGYHPDGAIGYTYPDLPAWVPQPFSLDVLYRNDEGGEIVLRVQPITLGGQGSISHLNLEASPIQEVREVDVNGQPAALLRLGTGSGEAQWQEIVWEQDDLLLSLSTANLTEDELLHMARAVH